MLLPDIPEAAAWLIYFAPLASFVAITAFLRRNPIAAGRLTIVAVATIPLMIATKAGS